MPLTPRRNESLEQVMAFYGGGDNHQRHDVLERWPSHLVREGDGQLCILGGQFPICSFLAHLELQMLLTSLRNEKLLQGMAFCGSAINGQGLFLLFSWASHLI